MKNKSGVKIGDKLFHKMYNEIVTVEDFLDGFDGKSVEPAWENEEVQEMLRDRI